MASEIRVTPISATKTLLDVFIKDLYDLTGHNSAKGIDTTPYTLNAYVKFLTVLEDFKSQKVVTPSEALKNATNSLDHLFFSFLISGSNLFILKISEQSHLQVLSTKAAKGRVALVSGTLRQWRDFLLRFDIPHITNTFYQCGLKPLFEQPYKLV